ncbi:hypothetical protein EV690_0212 [Celerinatantimonas diazotrophica]|uniref:Uncharacterized protein n=1 Tax=Celerinatantimonas diazotrophica TaxID=412034 RepID=A0A4R1KF70_9GAMM|nr:hypothetical protein EV690_0212 [Celerinatantimonas diazotrophica]CAG9298470.1 hypothetical protein CEDIAZO_03675 [Celerinatantimonas diazotrophica]
MSKYFVIRRNFLSISILIILNRSMTYILFSEKMSAYPIPSLNAIKFAISISRIGLSVFFFALAFRLSCFFYSEHYTRRARAREIGMIRHSLVYESQFVKKSNNPSNRFIHKQLLSKQYSTSYFRSGLYHSKNNPIYFMIKHIHLVRDIFQKTCQL